MPPKVKIDKQQVVQTATQLVHERGMQGLNAREIAKRIGCSTQPIFYNFESMEALQACVVEEIAKHYQKFTQTELQKQTYPPYKASGMAYITYAKRYANAFQLLFMRNRNQEEIKDDVSDLTQAVCNIIAQKNALAPEQAKDVHVALWVVVHGIATMAATSYLTFTEEQCSKILTDVYQSLIMKTKGGV